MGAGPAGDGHGARSIARDRSTSCRTPTAFLTEHPEAALAILRMTAARLDGLTQYLVDVKQQFAGLDGHFGMIDQILDSLVHHQSGPTRTGSVRDPEC